jgi:hypothetical protein
MGKVFPEECIGNPNHDPGTVTGLRIATDRTAVLHVLKDFQAIGYDTVSGFAVQMRDEADSTSIMLEFRVVQPIGSGSHHLIAYFRSLGIQKVFLHILSIHLLHNFCIFIQY